MSTKQQTTTSMQETFGGTIIGSEPIEAVTPIKSNLPYHTRLNPPKKIVKEFKKPTKTQVSINNARNPQELMQQYGMYKDPSIYTKNPEKIYMDLTKYGDYQSMLNETIAAKGHFMTLDTDIRAKFNNDPLQFANYLASPDFDVNEILTSDEQQALKNYHERIQAEEDFKAYQSSAEYKNAVAEQQLFDQYRKEQFDAWKKNRAN